MKDPTVSIDQSEQDSADEKTASVSDDTAVALSRRQVICQFACFGAAMATVHEFAAAAQTGSSGSDSNAAIAQPPVGTSADSPDELVKAVKIARAMRAGPPEITRDATVAEMDHHGNLAILRKGSNEWLCIPGDENRVGDPPHQSRDSDRPALDDPVAL